MAHIDVGLRVPLYCWLLLANWHIIPVNWIKRWRGNSFSSISSEQICYIIVYKCHVISTFDPSWPLLGLMNFCLWMHGNVMVILKSMVFSAGVFDDYDHQLGFFQLLFQLISRILMENLHMTHGIFFHVSFTLKNIHGSDCRLYSMLFRWIMLQFQSFRASSKEKPTRLLSAN